MTGKKKDKKPSKPLDIPSVGDLTQRIESLEVATIEDLLAPKIPIEVEVKAIEKKISIVVPKYEDYAKAGRLAGDDNWKSNLLLISFCLKKPRMNFKQLEGLRADVAMELIEVFNKLSGITKEELEANENLPKEKDSHSGE